MDALYHLATETGRFNTREAKMFGQVLFRTILMFSSLTALLLPISI
jgi:hypothetical protein